MSNAFRASAENAGSGTPRLVVAGDVDVASADLLVEAARDAVGDGSALELDLGEVTFMDSTGLNALLTVRSLVADRGGDLRVAQLSRHVSRVLELVGMLDTFTGGENNE